MISGKIKIDLTHTKYQVVKDCAEELGWKIITEDKPKKHKDKTSADLDLIGDKNNS